MALRPRTPRPSSLLLLPLLGLALVACGSDGGDAATTTVAATAVASPPGVRQVSPQDGQQILRERAGSITLIDVRTPEEYAAGHLEGAVNMDLEGGQFSAEIAGLPKDAAYMVYCHSGRRSALAAQAMSDAGFTDVYDLGGIAAWQAAGLPVVTG